MDDEKDTNFFQLSKEEQSQHSIPTITYPAFEVSAPKYQSQLKEIPWQEDFEHGLGIVNYTMAFLRAHERQGVVVTRHTVELSWAEKVVKIFENDMEKQHFFVSQLNCVLINDCWARDEFEIDVNDDSLIEDPNGIRDATALSVLRRPETVNGQVCTIMLLYDKKARSDGSNHSETKTDSLVILPFLGLRVLENISYLDLAAQIRRGDGMALDESLMKAVWRGVNFNMFYFEDEKLKLKKAGEEAWTSVQLPSTNAGGSLVRKRKLEDRSSPVEQRGEEYRVRSL